MITEKLALYSHCILWLPGSVFVFESMCVCSQTKRSKQHFPGYAARCSLQFHLPGHAIRQLTNPFNIVYLASLAHHFKGITLSRERERRVVDQRGRCEEATWRDEGEKKRKQER